MPKTCVAALCSRKTSDGSSLCLFPKDVINERDPSAYTAPSGIDLQSVQSLFHEGLQRVGGSNEDKV